MNGKDKTVRRLLDAAKRYPVLKVPVICLIFVIMSVYHFTKMLRHYRVPGLAAAGAVVAVIFVLTLGTLSPGASEYISSVSENMFYDRGIDPVKLDVLTRSYNDDNFMTVAEFIEAGENPARIDELLSFNDFEAARNPDDIDESADEGEIVLESIDETDEGGLKNPYGSAYDWRLILANKQNPLPEDHEIKLAGISGGLKVDERILDPLKRMFAAAKADGVDLYVCSAYRSHDRQTTLFNNKIKRYTAQGMTYLDAYTLASFSVTVPGTSEHELGLALDIVTPEYTELTEGFEDTDAGRWLKENAGDYGFILRYPKGKSNITGIIYEPGHYRYVGEEAAKQIMDNDLSLEEYLIEIGIR